jgi:hypothetical protein
VLSQWNQQKKCTANCDGTARHGAARRGAAREAASRRDVLERAFLYKILSIEQITIDRRRRPPFSRGVFEGDQNPTDVGESINCYYFLPDLGSVAESH